MRHANGTFVPLAFCLLPNKEQSTYEALFQLLIEECANIGVTFKPQSIVVGFEISIHSALKKIWPQSKIIGCRFHVTQAWYRKLSNHIEFLLQIRLYCIGLKR